jgi:hypothetical protein
VVTLSLYGRYVTPELAFEYHYFFTRKFWMAFYMQVRVVRVVSVVRAVSAVSAVSVARVVRVVMGWRQTQPPAQSARFCDRIGVMATIPIGLLAHPWVIHAHCMHACPLHARMLTACTHAHCMHACPLHARMSTACTHAHCMHACPLHARMPTACTHAHCMHACPLHAGAGGRAWRFRNV